MEGLFRGTWYRSQIRLEGDIIIPAPPFEPYNPFDLYFSANEIRQGEKSLYLEYLEVDSNQPEEVVKFCRRFGVLGNPYGLLQHEFLGIRKRVKKEKKIRRSSDSQNGLSPGEELDLSIAVIFSEVLDQGVFPPHALCSPMKISYFKGLQESFKSIFSPPSPPPPRWAEASPEEYKISLPKHYIHSGLHRNRVRPTIDWNIQKAQWEFVWTSLTLTGFFYVMTMLDFLGPGKTFSCPRCKKFFVTASKRMRFCSPSCQQNFKVQKYQKKKKEQELAAQKGKKPRVRKVTGKKK